VSARILLVEDAPNSLQLMTYLLEKHGHTVTGVRTAEDSIRTARDQAADLILMDLQLGAAMTGYQALRAIRADPRISTTPVIAVTALAMVGDRQRGLAAGFDEYLTKPIDPATFCEQIEAHLPVALHGRRPQAYRVLSQGQPAATSPHRRGNGEKILVVDDAATNRALLRSVLEPHGYRVLLAKTIADAIEAADAEPPDLVLCDVHIRGGLGMDLLDRLATVPVLALVPLAFITATAGRLDPLVRAGRAQVIRRPIEPGRLLDEVEGLLRPDPGG
jgi:two-component system cell cycle response regulator